MTTSCGVCAEHNPGFLVNEGGHWRCLSCGAVWAAGPPGPIGAVASTAHLQITSVDQLIEVLRRPDCGLARLTRSLLPGELQAYLETRRELEEPLRRQLGNTLQRLRDNPRLALFALRHELTDDPLELAAGVAIRSPAEIGPLVAAGAPRREAVLLSLRELTADGRLGEWLRARGVTGGERAAAAMEAARRAYPKEEDLPLYALLWHLAPDLGLQVDGDWVRTPRELAAWMERDAAHRERGLALLDRGWISTWLAATTSLGDARALNSLVAPGLTRAARAQTLLWLLDPDLPSPHVVAEPERLDLSLSTGGPETSALVTLSAKGPGHVWGTVDLQGAVPGIELVTKTWEGPSARVSVRIRPTALPSATPRDLALVVSVRGPRADQPLRVPIRLRVRRSAAARSCWWAAARAAESKVLPYLLGGISGGMIGAQIGAILGAIAAFLVSLVLFVPAEIVSIFVPNASRQIITFVGKLGGSAGIVACGGFGAVLGAGWARLGRGTMILLVLAAVGLGWFWVANPAEVEWFVKEMTFLG